eukprot:10669071-Ditylum_brightwellii.AAC.1
MEVHKPSTVWKLKGKDCTQCTLTEDNYNGFTPALLSEWRLPQSAATCSVQLNKRMRHHVRTSAGESVESYQHTEDYMKAGKGQGKTSSPLSWLFQSSTLLKSLED